MSNVNLQVSRGALVRLDFGSRNGDGKSHFGAPSAAVITDSVLSKRLRAM